MRVEARGVGARARRRRAFTALLALLALGAAGCSGGETPRHLILISLDTLRADHLGCYGHERPTSPHLDALAADGIVFEQAFAAAPWTLPSHASLLTGLYPSRHGALRLDTRMAGDVPTLAGILREAGFETAAIVNSLFLAESFGVARGFEHYAHVPEDDSGAGAARQVSDRALAWLARRGERRLFLFLHYYDVHSDYHSLPRYERLFVTQPGRLRGTTEELIGVKTGKIAIDPSDAEHLRRLYDAGIRQLDDELGRLFSQLDEGGWLAQSLVVVTSDHGEEFLEHGSVLHGNHHREVLQVPLILRGPSLPADVRVATPVSLVDVMPTVLDLLGVARPQGLDGADLRRLWQGGGEDLDGRRLFAETGPRFRRDTAQSVRTGRHKLLRDRDDVELFDVVDDPLETRNLIEERPEVARVLTEALDRLRARRSQGGASVEIAPEEEERLRALGYL